MALSDILLFNSFSLKKVGPISLIMRFRAYLGDKSKPLSSYFSPNDGMVRGNANVAETPVEKARNVAEVTRNASQIASKPNYSGLDYSLSPEKFLMQNYDHLPPDVKEKMVGSIQTRIDTGANPNELLEILYVQVKARNELLADRGERR